MSIFVSRNIKNMICSNRYIAGTLAVLCLFMAAACSKAGQDPVPSPSVLSVDITENVVIHPSSLDYFDYVISCLHFPCRTCPQSSENGSGVVHVYGEIPIESMTVGDFLLTYGNSFITTCIVRNNPEGI